MLHAHFGLLRSDCIRSGSFRQAGNAGEYLPVLTVQDSSVTVDGCHRAGFISAP